MIAIPKVRDAIHAGVKEASIKYLQWSRGWTLQDSGVEGLLVSGIASKLNERLGRDDSILLELPYTLVQRWSGASPKGRRVETFRGRKRADLAVFNAKGRTKYVIEVKRKWVQKQVAQDIERLCSATNKCAQSEGGKLMRGFLAVFHQRVIRGRVSREQVIEQLTEQFNGKTREAVKSLPLASTNQIKGLTLKLFPTGRRLSGSVPFSICVEVGAP